jgi:hypothetical protein
MLVRSRSWTAVAAFGLMLALGVPGLAACGHACGGQCGPPFRLQVIFRPGTSTQTAGAAVTRCAWEPFVIRVGRVYRIHGFPTGEPRGSLVATVYTRSISASQRNDRLLACLRRSHSVISAGYPD